MESFVTTMIECNIKILGAQFAANPDYKFGDPETDEMIGRTIGMLTELKEKQPRVVLKADPANPSDPLAVMARAMGRKIGYVCKDQRDKVRGMLKRSKRGMLAGDISDVVIYKHGYLFVTVECNEAVDEGEQEPGFDWSGWQADIPLLPSSEARHAEEEAEYMLEEELLPRLAVADVTELQAYLDIWMEGSRHDMSYEASCQRKMYVKLLEESERADVRALADELKHQSASMCCLHRLEERTLEWWPRLLKSDEVAGMWKRWRGQINGQLWYGLRLIDDILRQLPGNLYQHIDHLEMIFSQMYYLCIPRAALTTILSLLALREKTCSELGIAMKPMTEADYGQDKQPAADDFSMKDLASSFLKFPTKIALGMFGGVSTLLAWHPAWQRQSAKIEEQILAQQKEQQDRQEQRQDEMMETVKEVANKPTEIYYGDKNEFQDGAQLLKMGIPEGTDPAEIAARIAEQQKNLLEQKGIKYDE